MRMLNKKPRGPVWLIFSAIAIVALSSALAPAQTLTGHWAFDGDLFDQVGSNHATIPSGDSTVGTDNGKIGGAVTFDGTGDIAQLPSAILANGPFTLSFWEYTEAVGGGRYFMCNNSVSEFFLQRTDSAYNGKLRRNTVLGPSPALQTWHHNMISYDDTGDIVWYVDGIFGGKSDPESADKKPFVALSGDYFLGNRPAGDRSFSGKLDDLQIYSGAADGNQARYLATNPGATLDAYDPSGWEPKGLIAHWKFNGNLDDEFGNYHGSAIGDATAGTDGGAFAGSGAVFFDGDDAVVIDGEVLGAGTFSLAFWSKTDPADSDSYFVSDGENYSNLLLRRYNDKFTAQICGEKFSEFGPDGTSGTTWPRETWHHHVFTYGPEGEVQWYVDGQVRDAIDTGTGFFGLTSDLVLGNRTDLARGLTGWIDDLQLYDMELSAAEAQWLHDNPGSVVPEPTAFAMLLSMLLVSFARWGRKR